jgi:predicted amidohydrolase
MVVDPWGIPLAIAADRPCTLVVDCDLAQQDRIREALPALRHRRLGEAPSPPPQGPPAVVR